MAFNSKTNLKILDLICEGPIEGVRRSLKGVYLDETQVNQELIDQNAVQGSFKRGTSNQGLFTDTSFEGKVSQIISVNQPVGNSYSEIVDLSNLVTGRNYGKGQLIRTINDPEVDQFQLVFSIPRLFCTGVEGIARGQLFPAKIKFEVGLQEQGGTYRNIEFVNSQVNFDGDANIIEGISTNSYQIKSQPISLRNA